MGTSLRLCAVALTVAACSAGGPVFVNTWFGNAAEAGYALLNASYSALDAIELGCTVCEDAQCDGTVGWGGSPDSLGETTLDAIIMDATTHDVGAVTDLRRVKHAISAARKVMHYSQHTLLAGQAAHDFAVAAGLPDEDLHSNQSVQAFQSWVNASCQVRDCACVCVSCQARA